MCMRAVGKWLILVASAQTAVFTIAPLVLECSHVMGVTIYCAGVWRLQAFWQASEMCTMSAGVYEGLDISRFCKECGSGVR